VSRARRLFVEHLEARLAPAVDSVTTLTGVPNPANYGQTYTFTASVRPATTGPTATGDVTFVDTTTGTTLGVRTLNGGGDAALVVDGAAVSFLDAGLHTVRASYAGSATYNPSAANFTETVIQVSTATNVVNDHPSGSVFGEPVTYTATVTSATITPFGTVTFSVDDGAGHVTPMGTKPVDGSGHAVLTFNSLPMGTQTVTAAFNSNVDFKASSGTTSETVSQGSTSATLSTSKSPTVFGEPVTFTATITANAPSTLAPAGSVTFTDTTTGTTLGTANLSSTLPGSSQARLTVSSLSSASGGKTHTVQASYNTDGNYAPSTAQTAQTVNPAPTVTTVAGSPNPAVFEQPVTFTATVNPAPGVLPPTGSVVFTVDGTAQSAVPVGGAGRATLTLGLTRGPHTVSAAYTSNNSNSFLSSSSAQITEQVGPAQAAIVLAPEGSTVTLGRPATFTATVGAAPSAATPTGSVTFLVDGVAAATAVPLDAAGRAAFTISSLTLGSHTVAATYVPADGNFLAAGTSTTVAVVAPAPLVASGRPDGSAVLFAPDAAGHYATTPAATLAPFPGFAGDVRAAVADVDGDGFPDTVLVTGPGQAPARFAVVSGKDNTTVLVPPTDPFGNATFSGGGFVAAGDFDHDGRAEWVITPDQGGGPNVVVYSLVGTTATVRTSFLGIDDPTFRGGARAAVGDVNADGTPDLAVAAGFLGGPRVALFDGTSVFATPTRLVGDFFAFGGTDATTLRNGVFVALGDVDGDGFADLIAGGGPGGGPRVLTISGKVLMNTGVDAAQAAPLMNYFVAGNGNDRGGVRVAAKDADGDARADVVAGSGEGLPSRVRVYLGKDITSTAEPTTFQDLDPFGATLPGGVFVG
jgi:hypothetical protein